MARIKVLKDEAYSSLMQDLASGSDAMRALMEKNYRPPLEPGTIIESADISASGKAYFYRSDIEDSWYLPDGWYEVLND